MRDASSFDAHFTPELEAAADRVAACAGFPVPRASTSAGKSPEPKTPSDGAATTQARPIAFTDLEDGRVIVEVGDAQLALSVEEFSILRALLCVIPRRKR